MKIGCVGWAVVCTALSCAAQTGNLADWTKLIDKGDARAAKALCSPFVDSKDLAQRVEAQKCLANVALCGNSIIRIEGDNAGGGSIRDSYRPEAVDEALVHLNLGIELAPQDISIHLGRLHILEASGRYDEMIKALDQSCTLYKGKEAPDAWLAYAPELNDLRQYQVALEFMKVLDKHYTNHPDIVANIGAFLSLLKRDAEAIPYLEKAVAMAPEDPINTWDLGRAYDYTGQIALADRWYKKGLSLMTDPNRRKQNACLYAQFIEKKLSDRNRACSLQKRNCPGDQQTACAPSSSAPAKIP